MQNYKTALILGVSLVISFIIASGAFYRSKVNDNVISVTGSAEKIVSSDNVRWTSIVSRNVGKGELTLGSQQLKNDIDEIRKYLTTNGVDEKEITAAPTAITPTCDAQNYGYSYDKFGNQICPADRLTGYSLSQQITVNSLKVQEVTDLAQKAIDNFVGKGLLYNSQSIEYYYSKLSDLKIEMLGDATANAQARAKNIAKQAHSHLGGLQQASMGVFQITAPNSTEISDYGVFDTSSIEKKITAVVRASFLVR
jgi:hypothetical protein